MTNPTAVKFGFPVTVVAETGSWLVQVRPQQPALGSLVLVCKEPVKAFAEASPQAFAELKQVIAGVEAALTAFTAYDRINYLMLMMVDPDVHFHVIPRHEAPRQFGGRTFTDAGWPGPPALGQAVALEGEALDALVAAIRKAWTGA